MAVDKDYADNFLKKCNDCKLLEWADELHQMYFTMGLDIDALNWEEIKILAQLE